MNAPTAPDTTQADQAIRQAIQSRGWSPLPEVRLGASVRRVVAQKSFDTSVGPKVATVHLNPARSDDPYRTLCGDYQSEGSNILSASGVLVPVAATAEEAARLAEQFMERAESAIAGSYAVRLLLAA